MPINNIQFRAEIGNFNNAYQCMNLTRPFDGLSFFYNLFCEFKKSSIHTQRIIEGFLVSFSFFLVIVVVPVVFFAALILSKMSKLEVYLRGIYVFIYICLTISCQSSSTYHNLLCFSFQVFELFSDAVYVFFTYTNIYTPH